MPPAEPDDKPWDGLPENPTHSGYHWMTGLSGPAICRYWASSTRDWRKGDGAYLRPREMSDMIYLGPAHPPPADPLDTPLPCRVTVGKVVFAKGTPLRKLLEKIGADV